jgi:polyphosphate kinase
MGRNLNRRIEILVPIEDRKQKKWVRKTYLQAYLDDTQRSRVLLPDGSYERVRDTADGGPDVHVQWLKGTM